MFFLNFIGIILWLKTDSYFFYVAAFYQYQGSCKKPSQDSNAVLEEPMKSPKLLCYSLWFWPQKGCGKKKLCFSPNVTQFFSTKSFFGHNLKCSKGSNSLKTPIFFSWHCFANIEVHARKRVRIELPSWRSS